MAGSSNVAKLSVSLPSALARKLKKRVGERGVSSFAARAIEHELEREQLGVLIDELDSELGPLNEGLLAEARSAWADS